jgi:hypothetical protein
MVLLVPTPLRIVFESTVHRQAHIYMGMSSGQGSNFVAEGILTRYMPIMAIIGDRELKVIRTHQSDL